MSTVYRVLAACFLVQSMMVFAFTLPAWAAIQLQKPPCRKNTCNMSKALCEPGCACPATYCKDP